MSYTLPGPNGEIWWWEEEIGEWILVSRDRRDNPSKRPSPSPLSKAARQPFSAGSPERERPSARPGGPGKLGMPYRIPRVGKKSME